MLPAVWGGGGSGGMLVEPDTRAIKPIEEALSILRGSRRFRGLRRWLRNSGWIRTVSGNRRMREQFEAGGTVRLLVEECFQAHLNQVTPQSR